MAKTNARPEDNPRYQALKAEIERLGYKVEDVPRLLKEVTRKLNLTFSKAG